MRILVYKRTHPGDPDENGCFGANDCMGAVRGRDFDAVIGIGGIGREARSHGIDRKLNWIGIGPRFGPRYRRGPLVSFEHFQYFGTTGDRFRLWAPLLARRIYGQGLRHLMSDSMSELERQEIESILRLARDAPPSRKVPRYRRQHPTRSCKPRCGERC